MQSSQINEENARTEAASYDYANGSGWNNNNSSSDSGAADAALGMMGGMAMGSAMTSAAERQAQPTYGSYPPPETTTNNYYGAPSPYRGYQASGGYQAGPPPPGGIVGTLPMGSSPVTVNGTQYFFSNGTYYKPYFNGSQVEYQVTQL